MLRKWLVGSSLKVETRLATFSMAKLNLTRQEALELITPVIDGEVEEDKRIAFLDYIEEDDSIRLKYESAKRIKKLVSTRYKTVRAPDRLKKRIRDFLSDPENQDYHGGPPNIDLETSSSIVDKNTQKPPAFITGLSKLKNNRWTYAASVLGVLMIIILYIFANPGTPGYNVEEFAYRHFSNNKGAYIPPTITAASPTDAELALASNMGFTITIPPIQNSEFKGVVLSEFIPDFKSPMLEYYDPERDQYIYIFAFRINDLNNVKKLKRDPNAVKNCINPEDYYVRNVNGKHVVSWKWNNIWYAAISNHNGNILASRVGTLEYNVNGQRGAEK